MFKAPPAIFCATFCTCPNVVGLLSSLSSMNIPPSIGDVGEKLPCKASKKVIGDGDNVIL